MEILLRLLDFADTYMPFLILLIFLSVWKLMPRRELLLFAYLVISFVIFGITIIMGVTHHNNMALYHFFSLVELILMVYYFLDIMDWRKKRLVFFLISTVYFIFWLLNLIYWEPLNMFNSNSAGLANLIILALCMSYMLVLSKSDEILYFQRLPSFWIAGAFLVYCAVSFLVILAFKYFLENNLMQEAIDIWYIQNIANIVKFTMIAIGILCYRRPFIQNHSLS